MKCQCSEICDLDVTKERVLCFYCGKIIHPDHFDEHEQKHLSGELPILDIEHQIKHLSPE